ncbi:GTPase Era [Mycoplasma capricolum subsp. capripneumoniae]|uniref:GTPase Era n=1 Tax=Mycoplasma capricolum subsp. capripneumoniae 87001 TaxID=1124992 RepID=A0A9N7G8P9_MYCCC|nr:GTPase Era [Mycoplasma capricolum]AJK51545.1 GTP-binding protein Era [Mycoplasma capricolum subsp. capripneumoniae 87001]AOQ22205.1 GTPase Era [Mycoplasma capricolum subsp. capripneumoniae M1601]AQU77563.1 GTPase Era [Mycoplasma capricolum subsp. capripneumoniae]KEY84565.1 GTP-binding protein Era-like protein [Mycoplasma capricolum subsp. capripneumoniae 99108]QDL19671.1 GTPase Era [Mycoplasma capricolum subsp. capripneumoniae]
MNKFKSGFVSIIGRPNVGKSTLLNKLIGEKISIVTNKPQTTRNNIRGILTKKDQYQIVFIDTPGVHTTKKQLDKVLNTSALKSTKDVDVILFLAPSDEAIGKNDLFLLKQIQNLDVFKILVITKADNVTKEQLILKANQWSAYQDQFDEIIITSSLTNLNIEKLLELIVNNLSDNDYQFYDDDILTDQSDRFMIKEIIRENILLKTGQEVPHSVAVLVEHLEQNETEMNISAAIIVERQSQKSIIIGKKGVKISDIRYKSKKQIQALFKRHINLELFVKVQENWRNSPSLIKKMGYNKDQY